MALPVLGRKPRATFHVPPRYAVVRADEDLDTSTRVHHEQSEPEPPTELPHTTIILSPAALRRGADGKPYLVARRCPVDTLQDELEIECEFQLTHDDGLRLVGFQSDEITAADLALYLEPEALKEALHRLIKFGLHSRTMRDCGVIRLEPVAP